MTGLGPSGQTCDFFAYNSSNQVWNGSSFGAWSDGSYASYRVTATEAGASGRFNGTAPTGTYRFELRLRGASVAASPVVWEEILNQAASDVRAEMATELGRIDATISSRLAASSYTAPTTPPTASENATAAAAAILATPSNKLATNADGTVDASIDTESLVAEIVEGVSEGVRGTGPSTLTVTVRGTDNALLQNASVWAKQDGTTQGEVRYTGTNGQAQLPIFNGDVVIYVSHPDYVLKSQDETIDGDTAVTVDLTAKPQPVASPAGTVTGWFYLYELGILDPNAEGTYSMTSEPASVGVYHDKKQHKWHSKENPEDPETNGRVMLIGLVPGAEYKIVATGYFTDATFVGPESAGQLTITRASN